MNRPNAALTRLTVTAGVLAGCALFSAAPANAEPYKSHPHSNHYDDSANQQSIRARLRRIGAIECSGNQSLRYSNVLIEASEDAITAKDQCRIELIDSHIIGRRHGIRMGGKSTVILRRSYIEGARSAVRIGTAATLVAENSRFQGDMERLANQVNYRDRGGNTWNGSFRTTPLPNQAPEEPQYGGGGLQPSGPYSCRGSETLYLDRLDITSSGDGVTVAGNCNVVVRDSRIVGSRYGILVRGRGTVSVQQSEVQGAQGAVHLSDFATLSAQNATFRGGLMEGTSTIYRDQGGNQWLNGGIVAPRPESRPIPSQQPIPSQPAPSYGDSDIPRRDDLRLSGPYQCNGRENLRLEGLRIETPGDGLVVQGDCRVEIIGSHIIADGYGIVVRGRGSVTVRNSKIKGRIGAAELSDQARLSASGSRFFGEMKRFGYATYRDQGGNEWRFSPNAR